MIIDILLFQEIDFHYYARNTKACEGIQHRASRMNHLMLSQNRVSRILKSSSLTYYTHS